MSCTGGGPNVAGTRRVGFNATYCAAHVHSVIDGGAYGMVVRGSNPCSHLVQDPVPTSNSPTEGEKQAHKAKMDGMAKSIMDGADLEAFSRVSEQRTGRNLPPHVSSCRVSAASTSLASNLLQQNEKGAS